ncbi:MAG: tetratricopeptide repeat protein [Mariprofundaceae bacterium]|nr:tetratricopeptide repeat protein [Mariprofundaceae bacterium]
MKKQLAVIGFICMLLCCSSGAYAGWFVPENRIAWQAWHDNDDTTSLEHWDYSSKGMFGRATVLMRMGRLREAERGFRQAMEDAGGLEPAYIASVWYNLGNCLYQEGALKQAQEAWRQALQYNPEHAKAAHNLAVVGGLLKRRREQMNHANSTSRLKQKGKSRKQTHGDQRQAENGLPISGKDGKTRKGEHGDGGNVKTMSQAEREVNGVRDSMDVFLRHRLAEKSARTAPFRRGPPW